MGGFYEEAVVQKLGLRSLLDLALCLPANYEDRRLARSFTVGATQTFQARVREAHRQGKNFKVTFFLPAFNRAVSAMIFHPKPFHYKTFQQGEELFISAKVGEFNGFIQLSQPKKVGSVGELVPIYKYPKVRQDSLKAVIRKYLDVDALLRCGLYEQEARTLYGLHFPANVPDFDDPRLLHILKSVELLNHLQKLSKKRRDFPAKIRLSGSLEKFYGRLPFTLTPEQQSAIDAVQKDLNSDTAAKRMVVGDVGSGKTMAILAAAMIAYPHYTLLMAPTSILANQLYEEAQKYLPFETALLTSRKRIGDYRQATFVIGTHALLHKSDLPSPALVMVDEQHRFGTKQRHALATLTNSGEARPHFLQFSATPIPRSQAMIDSKMIDISLITSTPFKKDITTEIVKPKDFGKLKTTIQSEIDKGRQALIIYPLVSESENYNYQSLEEGQGFWLKHFDGVYVTHGKDKEKDSVLEEFREKGKILLATTVVEVGISLPRLSTIVIVGAENMGLATLHQLRGRVSRNGLKGYCYLFTKSDNTERLQQFAKTKNGFEIARLDLKFRKSGDMIDGKLQSGEQFRWVDMAEDEALIEQIGLRLDKER